MNLTNIDIKSIQTLMDNIKNEMPFCNEAQFQEALLNEIRKNLDPNLYASIEVLNIEKINKKNKRNYSDIIIFNEDGDFIAIELKYKIKGKNATSSYTYLSKYGDIIAQPQGAADLSRYGFLKDIMRIEHLIKGNCKVSCSYTFLKKCIRGYAILLSNDSSLWTQKKSTCKSQYKNFCIADDDNCSTQCEWLDQNQLKNNIEVIKYNSKYPGFRLNKAYICNWSDNPYFEDKYNPKRSPDFRYLAIEVK